MVRGAGSVREISLETSHETSDIGDGLVEFIVDLGIVDDERDGALLGVRAFGSQRDYPVDYFPSIVGGYFYVIGVDGSFYGCFGFWHTVDHPHGRTVEVLHDGLLISGSDGVEGFVLAAFEEIDDGFDWDSSGGGDLLRGIGVEAGQLGDGVQLIISKSNGRCFLRRKVWGEVLIHEGSSG